MRQERRELRPEREEDLERGWLGGSAAMTAAAPGIAAIAVRFWQTRPVRWSAIWAGALLAIALDFLLVAIGLAIALSAFDPAAETVAQGIIQPMVVWSIIATWIALFVGGLVLGRQGAFAGWRNAIAQGSTLWALYVVTSVILTATPVAGFPFIQGVIDFQALFAPGATDIGPGIYGTVVRTAIYGLWWFAIGMIIAWIVAVAGTTFGMRGRIEEVEEA